MPEQLKLCPFCGGNHLLPFLSPNSLWYVYCDDCDTRGPMADTRETAIDLWNRRAPDPEVERAVEGMADLLRQILAYSTPEPTPVHSLGLLDIAGVHKMARRRLAAYDAARKGTENRGKYGQ